MNTNRDPRLDVQRHVSLIELINALGTAQEHIKGTRDQNGIIDTWTEFIAGYYTGGEPILWEVRLKWTKKQSQEHRILAVYLKFADGCTRVPNNELPNGLKFCKSWTKLLEKLEQRAAQL